MEGRSDRKLIEEIMESRGLHQQQVGRLPWEPRVLIHGQDPHEYTRCSIVDIPKPVIIFPTTEEVEC